MADGRKGGAHAYLVSYYMTGARKARETKAALKPAGQKAGPASKLGFPGFEAGFKAAPEAAY
jgi:hypothetical protein